MADSSISNESIAADSQTQLKQDATEALATPTQSKSLRWSLLYGLANAVIGVGNITFYTLLLPSRIAGLAPGNQTSTFIVISALGAVASIITNPLVGAFSDRTTSRIGRRLPWIMVGIVVLIVSMLTLAYASTLLLLGIGSIVLQIAINMLLSALSAIIPDQVPLRQRATVSAFGGMAPLFGGLIGQVIVAQVVKDITSSFLILAQVSACILIVFSLVLREDPLSKEVATPFHLKDVPKTFWLNPRTYPDFALTWIARCCIFLASTTVVNYMYYFLQEDIHYTHTTGQPVAQGVQQFYLIYVISLLVSSLVCGKLSDLFLRRKIFVIGSSLVMTIGLFLFAFFPVWSMVIVAAVVLGIGFGGYLAVDLALASQLLPVARDHGKDFGIMNAAIFLPMLIAPIIAGIVLSGLHSYLLLFLVLALATIIAAIFIIPIKSVQ